MKPTLAFFLLITLLIASCTESKSPLLNQKLSKNNIISLSEKLNKDRLISNHQLEYFATGLNEMLANGDSLVGKSVENIISVGSKQKRKSILSSAVSNSSKAEISLAISYRLNSFSPSDSEGNLQNVASFIFQNNTDIDINKVEGTLEIRYKEHNKLLKNFPVLITDIIPAGKAIQKNISYIHDPNNNRDILLRQDLNKLIAVWVPKSVEFVSGKKIII